MLFEGTGGQPWGNAARVSRLVFIGRHLDRTALETGLRRCLASAR